MENETKELDYEPQENNATKLKNGNVVYEVKPNRRLSCETEANAKLYWDSAKSRWLASVSGKFLEGYEQGQQLFLDFCHLPAELNQSAIKKLLEAYKINSSKVELSEVPNLEPSKLEILARTQ